MTPGMQRIWTKPVYSLTQWFRDFRIVREQAGVLAQIYLRRGLDAGLRERLWVAVSAANQSRYCSYVHQRWAQRVGLQADDIDRLVRADLSREEGRARAALEFALHWLHEEFGPVPTAVWRVFCQFFGPSERMAIKALIRAATLANLSGNTFDALWERLHGRPVVGSHTVDEIVIGSSFVVTGLVLLPVLRWLDPQPLRLWRAEFRSFSERFARRAIPVVPSR